LSTRTVRLELRNDILHHRPAFLDLTWISWKIREVCDVEMVSILAILCDMRIASMPKCPNVQKLLHDLLVSNCNMSISMD